MKLILIVLTLIPFNIYSQNINIKYESGIDSLILKNNTINQSLGLYVFELRVSISYSRISYDTSPP